MKMINNWKWNCWDSSVWSWEPEPLSHFISPISKRNLLPAVLVSYYLQWCVVSWTKVETPEGNLRPTFFLVHLFRASSPRHCWYKSQDTQSQSTTSLVLLLLCSHLQSWDRGSSAAICNQLCPPAGGGLGSVGSLPELWCSFEMSFLCRYLGFFMVPCSKEEQLYCFTIQCGILLVLPSEAGGIRSSQGSLM